MSAIKENNVEELTLLLDNGADSNLFKKNSDGPLHYAAMFGYYDAARHLINYGADINAKGEYKRTPLIYAASSGRSVKIVKLLIDSGADIHAKNEEGENSLFELITRDEANYEIAELLIDSGIDLNSQAKHHGTPLHWAAFCGRLKIIKLLIQKGANIYALDQDKNTPIRKAMSRDNIDCVKYLFGKSTLSKPPGLSEMNVLEYAVEKNDFDFAEKIVKQYKKDKIKFPDGALTKAAEAGNLKMMEYLIQSGILPDAKDYWDNETPLMKASYYGKIDAVKFLIQKGADITARDNRGNTALLHASWRGHTALVEELLDQGADINEKNNLNWNALMQACVEGHFEIAKLLIEKGSPLNEIDAEQGATALTLAKHSKNQQLIDCLLNNGALDRKIRKREKNEDWFSILDCDICKYLPDKKDLGNSEMSDRFDLLEKIYTESDQPERYTEVTDVIYKCPNCGTYYHHHHLIDTEDSFISGPHINQFLFRYNLLHLKNTLEIVGKAPELNELKKNYPRIILQFEKIIISGTNIKSDFLIYIIESLTDYYLSNGEYDLLYKNLLQNQNSGIVLKTALDLILLYKEEYREYKFPIGYDYRNWVKEIQFKAEEFFKINIKKFKSCIKNFENNENAVIQLNYKKVIDTAKYYKLFS